MNVSDGCFARDTFGFPRKVQFSSTCDSHPSANAFYWMIKLIKGKFFSRLKGVSWGNSCPWMVWITASSLKLPLLVWSRWGCCRGYTTNFSLKQEETCKGSYTYIFKWLGELCICSEFPYTIWSFQTYPPKDPFRSVLWSTCCINGLLPDKIPYTLQRSTVGWGKKEIKSFQKISGKLKFGNSSAPLHWQVLEQIAFKKPTKDCIV